MGPQCRRVLKALRRHPDGICQPEFLLPNVIDGGHPITRLAARIKDLKDDGYEIVEAGERYSCKVYKLRVEVPVASVSADASLPPSGPDADGHLDPEPGGTLFELPHKPTSPYDEAA